MTAAIVRASPRPRALIPDARLPRKADDDRVCCSDCSNHSRFDWRCSDHVRAGLSLPDVGPDLAAMPQRCAAFSRQREPPAERRIHRALQPNRSQRNQP